MQHECKYQSAESTKLVNIQYLWFYCDWITTCYIDRFLGNLSKGTLALCLRDLKRLAVDDVLQTLCHTQFKLFTTFGDPLLEKAEGLDFISSSLFANNLQSSSCDMTALWKKHEDSTTFFSITGNKNENTPVSPSVWCEKRLEHVKDVSDCQLHVTRKKWKICLDM